MAPNRKPGFTSLLLVLSLTLMLFSSGCLGRYAAWGKVEAANLEVTENRYGRQGLFWLMSPIYMLASLSDILIFNTWEFWSGTNPLDKGEAEIDVDMD